MAARFDALNRLWNTVRESSHDFRASTDVFPIFETEKVSRSLEVQERGAANGANNRPVKSGRALDEVEQQIVAKVEEEKKVSYQLLEDQFQTFSDRLRSLDFQGQFGLIRQANFSSLADFKAEVTVGQDELHGLRRSLKDVEEELTIFKQDHGLRRTAKVTSSAHLFFKVSLLVLLLLVETVLNGSFLAKGNQLGMLGGVTEAFTFAFLNIGSALLIAVFFARFILHRNFLLKLGGLLAFVGYLALAILLNLALAHYRELSATVFSDASAQVVGRLLTAPFGLTDLQSWTLFGVGLMFSVIAFIDGCTLSDPYPGFATRQRRVDVARDEYIARKEELIEQLKEIRDEHNDKVEAIIRDLSQRRSEHGAIISHRTRSARLFVEHQNQLERAANSLLTIYREANRQTRTEPEPKYFTTPYKMDRLTPTLQSPEEWNDRELSDQINTAQKELSEQMMKIGREFEEAVERYRQLDNLFPGT